MVIHLSDLGLLGFHGSLSELPEGWLDKFLSDTREWANSNSWLGGDEPLWAAILYDKPQNSQIWTPDKDITPPWVNLSPSYLLLAEELISKGKHLSGLNWRDFEKLIGYLLEQDGWDVNVTQATKDGGIDIVATKNASSREFAWLKFTGDVAVDSITNHSAPVWFDYLKSESFTQLLKNQNLQRLS